MKKNRTLRIAVLMLALTLLTCCFVGSTFAKYTSSAEGTDSVTVAAWQIKINGTDITAATDNVPTFDLFATAAEYDEDGNDVAAERVAPGTKGSFNYTVQNLSEVSAEYTITFEVTFPAGVNSERFKFYSDAGMTQEIVAVDGVYTVASEEEIEEDDDALKTINVYWKWTFEAEVGGSTNDTTDTTLGILAQNGTTVIKVDSDIVVEQVD